jgi:hypothetical protein
MKSSPVLNWAPRQKDVQEVEVQLHAFLPSALDGGEWSVLHPGRFIPIRNTQAGGWVGHKIWHRGEEKQSFPRPCQESNPCRPSRSLVTVLNYLLRFSCKVRKSNVYITFFCWYFTFSAHLFSVCCETFCEIIGTWSFYVSCRFNLCIRGPVYLLQLAVYRFASVTCFTFLRDSSLSATSPCDDGTVRPPRACNGCWGFIGAHLLPRLFCANSCDGWPCKTDSCLFQKNSTHLTWCWYVDIGGCLFQQVMGDIYSNKS